MDIILQLVDCMDSAADSHSHGKHFCSNATGEALRLDWSNSMMRYRVRVSAGLLNNL